MTWDGNHASPVQTLGAPEASIEGAETFDGIFLTGILASLAAQSKRVMAQRVCASSGYGAFTRECPHELGATMFPGKRR